jgi:hypothetical protein
MLQECKTVDGMGYKEFSGLFIFDFDGDFKLGNLTCTHMQCGGRGFQCTIYIRIIQVIQSYWGV